MDTREKSARRVAPGRPNSPMRTSALMRSLRHDRRTRPAVAALLIFASILGLRAEQARTTAMREQWGPMITAWVAAADFEAGHLLSEGDLEARLLPPAAVPPDAVADPPHGSRLADPVGRGEIVRAARIRGGDISVNGSRVGPGRGAVALNSAAAHLEVGDRVDLYGLLDGVRVADDTEIITITDGFPVVAIDDSDLAGVIRAFTVGDVVPVLVD